MLDRKAIVRHELANLLTTVTILVADSGLKPAEKEPIEDRVRMAGMILTYENIFLGKRQSFFMESVDVSELLRILCGVFGDRRNLDKSERRLSEAHLRVVANRNGLADALELICRKWISDNAPMDFEMDAVAGRLTFRHRPGAVLNPKNVDLLEVLRNDIGSPEWGFQLALRLLEMNYVQVSFPEGKMTLKFRLK